MTSLLKDHAAQRPWRSAAAAVFVEARTLEQEVCSDVRLQQALLLCRASGQAHAGGAASRRLCRSLLKHMQLEALHPGAFAMAAAAAAGADTAHVQQQRLPEQPEVLSAAEKAALLFGLRAEHKALSSRIQALLADDAAAPVVQLDADSRRIVLAPLLQDPAAAANGAAAAEDDDAEELALTLPLVIQLLQRHPDAAVRAEVYAAGLLQRLDGLLALWRELAEVRRKIGRCVRRVCRRRRGCCHWQVCDCVTLCVTLLWCLTVAACVDSRMQGGHSYADIVLQHSLLGSPAAAAGFCEHLAAALQPAAEAAVAVLQQQQQEGTAGSDLPHHMHKVCVSVTCAALQQVVQVQVPAGLVLPPCCCYCSGC